MVVGNPPFTGPTRAPVDHSARLLNSAPLWTMTEIVQVGGFATRNLHLTLLTEGGIRRGEVGGYGETCQGSSRALCTCKPDRRPRSFWPSCDSRSVDHAAGVGRQRGNARAADKRRRAV